MISGAPSPEELADHRADGLLTAEDRAIPIDDTAEWPFDAPNLVRFDARRRQAGLLRITILDLLR
jgi:hypothetical protein